MAPGLLAIAVALAAGQEATRSVTVIHACPVRLLNALVLRGCAGWVSRSGSNLKNELVHHCRFDTREAARAAIFSSIELFYNRTRLHQTLGYRTPVEFEQRYESGA